MSPNPVPDDITYLKLYNSPRDIPAKRDNVPDANEYRALLQGVILGQAVQPARSRELQRMLDEDLAARASSR